MTTGSKYGKFSASCDIRSRYVLIKLTFYVENTTKFVLILLFQKESNVSGRKKNLKELVTSGKVTVNTSQNKCTWTICQTEFFDKTKTKKEK